MLHGKCKEIIKKLTAEKEALEKQLAASPENRRKLQEQLDVVKSQLEKMTALARDYKQKFENADREIERMKESVPQDYAIFLRKHPGGKKDEIDILLHGGLCKVVSRIKDVPVEDLKCGWEIIMNQSGNTAIATTKNLWRWGSQVIFKANLTDELVLVSGHSESDTQQCILAPELRSVNLKQGDQLLNCGGLLVKVLPKTEEANHDIQSVKNLDFTKVGGLSDQIEQIQEALLPFIEKEVYLKVLKGEDMPKGIILDGPPGCGKTLLARVIASYLSRQKGKDGYFIAITSTELINKYVGETERKMRELFDRAKEKAMEGGLVVIFIDEIDALLKDRNITEEKEPWMAQSVAQFCGLLDGVEAMTDVLVIGATNLKEKIDPAILRPGRLTVHIRVPRPNREGAREILKIYLSSELPFARKYFSEELYIYNDYYGTEQQEMIQLDKNPEKIRDHFIDTILNRLFYTGEPKAVTLDAGTNEPTELTIDNKIEFAEDGRLKLTYLKDHLSGDMLKNIVEKARRIAFSRYFAMKKQNPETKAEMFKKDFFEAVDAEYLRIATSLKAVKTESGGQKDQIGFVKNKDKK